MLIFWYFIYLFKVCNRMLIFMVKWRHVGCGVHWRAMILERWRRRRGEMTLWGPQQAFCLYITCTLCQLWSSSYFYGYVGDNIPVWNYPVFCDYLILLSLQWHRRIGFKLSWWCLKNTLITKTFNNFNLILLF